MDIKLHKSTRGIWIFIDGKHKKTVPAIYESMILANIEKLSFDRKHLSEIEKTIFKLQNVDSIIKNYIEDLQTKEVHLYRLIKDLTVTGVRFVESKNGDRYELCFDNNLKIRCKKGLFAKHPVKLPTAYLNY